MGIAAVAFGWTPEVFWNSTAHEFYAAIEFHEEYNSPKKPD